MFSLTKTSFIVLFSLIYLQFSGGVHSSTFTTKNECSFIIWPAILSTSPLLSTGFALQPGHTYTFRVPPAWTLQFWGRTLDINNNFSCGTGDCHTSKIECAGGSAAGQPVTLVEFYFNGDGTMEFSLLFGNLPLKVAQTSSSNHYNVIFCPKSRINAGNEKEISDMKTEPSVKVVKYTGLIVVIAIISGFIIFRKIIMSAGTRAEIGTHT